MEESKLLLFIVEGRTDETALAPALEKIINNTIKFKVMRSDITCDYASTVDNIEERIKKVAVRKFLSDNSHFTANDICGIVHIVDLDGSFTSDEIIQINNDIDKAQYYDEHIENQEDKLEEFKLTRENKRKILKHLASIKEIKIPYGIVVPYEIYYMSCNLDHVLHNKRNSTNDEKKNDSITFADECDDPIKFEELFNSTDIKFDGNYQSTWLDIQNDFNSLKRGSNFWLCIAKYKKK